MRENNETTPTLQAREEARQSLRDSGLYPNLRQTDPQAYDSLKVGSRNIKIQLKEAFPGIKFSVRSESYANGCSIRINWTDGPTTEAVEAITGCYQQGRFDGMIDLYEYNNSSWTEVFGGAKYVQASRSSSNEAYLRAVAEIEKEWGITLKVSYTSYNTAYISNEDDANVDGERNMQYWTGSQLVNRRLSETDYREEVTQ